MTSHAKNTLIIDTSGPYSTVVVSEEWNLIATTTIRGRPAAQIHDQIRAVLEPIDLKLSQIDQFAVVVGPGSWTGLNIGVTTVKLLAQLLGASVIPLSSLDALMKGQLKDQPEGCAFMNAGRGRVYRSWYDSSYSTTVSGIAAIETLLSEIGNRKENPLVVEYGDALGKSLHAHVSIHQSLRLTPEGLLETAASGGILSGEEIVELIPDYMQPTLAERDAPVP